MVTVEAPVLIPETRELSRYFYIPQAEVNAALESAGFEPQRRLVKALRVSPDGLIGMGLVEVDEAVCKGHFGLFRGVDQKLAEVQTGFLLDLFTGRIPPDQRPVVDEMNDVVFKSPAAPGMILNPLVRRLGSEGRRSRFLNTTYCGGSIISQSTIEQTTAPADIISLFKATLHKLSSDGRPHEVPSSKRVSQILTDIGYGPSKKLVDDLEIERRTGKGVATLYLTSDRCDAGVFLETDLVEAMAQAATVYRLKQKPPAIDVGRRPIFTEVRLATFNYHSQPRFLFEDQVVQMVVMPMEGKDQTFNAHVKAVNEEGFLTAQAFVEGFAMRPEKFQDWLNKRLPELMQQQPLFTYQE